MANLNNKPYIYKPEVTLRALKVFNRNFVVFLKHWKSSLMFNFIEPLLYLAALGFGLGVYVEEVEGMSYLQYIAPGLVVSSAMWSTSFECTYGSFTRMQLHRIFHAMITTPLSVDDVVTGEIIYGAFKSFLYGTVILVVASVLGLISSPWVLLTMPVLFFVGIVFAETAMIWTSISPNFDSFAYYFTLIITPMFLFSGVFFPVKNMPYFVQVIAWLTPLFHAVEISRNLAVGQVSVILLLHFFIILLFAVLLFYLPLIFMRRRLIK
ncbi:MAG: ABC transporter permease [Candidatus Syntrophonatronum acetioxidans]|uniref:Transport permease protein n=1 Tax=Candidatus Syntrophonatronum acetioxidans TaxID=1795816 RepID=A0A424YFF5_9FIRM|nr:MAG: ABC transporter permease [Candidatus Syntrophonatronum acetioxidans]